MLARHPQSTETVFMWASWYLQHLMNLAFVNFVPKSDTQPNYENNYYTNASKRPPFSYPDNSYTYNRHFVFGRVREKVQGDRTQSMWPLQEPGVGTGLCVLKKWAKCQF